MFGLLTDTRVTLAEVLARQGGRLVLPALAALGKPPPVAVVQEEAGPTAM